MEEKINKIINEVAFLREKGEQTIHGLDQMRLRNFNPVLILF